MLYAKTVSNKFKAGAFDPHGVPATLSPRIHRRKERAKASRQVACACAYRYDHPELPFRSGARRQKLCGTSLPNGVCMEGAPTISLRDRKRDPSRRARTCQPRRIPRGQFACNARMKLLRRGTSRCINPAAGDGRGHSVALRNRHQSLASGSSAPHGKQPSKAIT
jgi:hypothetical protein